MGKRFFIIISTFLASLTVAGCVASTPRTGTVYQRLQAEDPDVRTKAIMEVGNKKNRKAIPLLVSRLDDTNPEVRMFAGTALLKIVGEETYNANGWKFYQTPQERQKGVDKWKLWIRDNMPKSKGKGMWNTANSNLKPTTKP